ncbi:unnamed protein product [Ceratitis capitata]|uniref:(Mediterranean fruit fly) hypothetical protein n=1 Tax=Ceratitis capitata TaxID=7213 RepID=A0A811VJA6_CERCA|nr:unnamed protein product [Ceratitis capitata]
MEEQLPVFTVSYFMDTLYQSTSLTDWKERKVPIMKNSLPTTKEEEAEDQGSEKTPPRRPPPRLMQVGRAFSEMSPLNPSTASSSCRGATSTALQLRRDSGQYGSIFPFGFLRLSLQKAGSSMQAGKIDCLSEASKVPSVYCISLTEGSDECRGKTAKRSRSFTSMLKGRLKTSHSPEMELPNVIEGGVPSSFHILFSATATLLLSSFTTIKTVIQFFDT